MLLILFKTRASPLQARAAQVASWLRPLLVLTLAAAVGRLIGAMLLWLGRPSPRADRAGAVTVPRPSTSGARKS